MLRYSETYRLVGRDTQTEYVLGVLGHSRFVATLPFRKDRKTVGKVPVDEIGWRCANPGFFFQFSDSALREGFVTLHASGYRLPESRREDPFEQQDMKCGRMNNDEH